MNRRIINFIFSWLLAMSVFAQQSWLSLGVQANETGNYKAAINHLQKALETGADKGLCYSAMAFSYKGIQDYEKSIAYLQKAIDNGADKKTCYTGLALNYEELNNFSKEAEFWLKTLDYTDKKGIVYIRLAMTYGNLHDYLTSINYASKAIDNGYADKAFAYSVIASNYNHLKEYQKVIEYCQKVLDCGEASALKYRESTYSDMAYASMKLTNYSKAFEYFSKSALLDDVSSYGWLGELYYFGKGTNVDYSKAYEYFKKSSEANIFRGYIGLARCSFEGRGTTQNKAEAYRLIEKSIELAVKNGTAGNQAQCLAYKGEMLFKDGNIKEAEMLWKEISQLDENYATTSEDYFCQMMRGGGADGVDVGMDIASVKNNETFVIIISNENYKREERVPFAINDGKRFYEYCTKTLGMLKKNVKFMEDATINDMKYAVGWIEKIGDAFGGDAKLIVYYSGHGIPDEKGTSAYLLPVDGYGTDVSTGYKFTDLYASLNSASAKSVTVFLDACFCGTKRDGSMLASARGVAIKTKQETPAGNMIVLSAAQGDETAYPYNEKRHGLFTEKAEGIKRQCYTWRA